MKENNVDVAEMMLRWTCGVTKTDKLKNWKIGESDRKFQQNPEEKTVVAY